MPFPWPVHKEHHCKGVEPTSSSLLSQLSGQKEKETTSISGREFEELKADFPHFKNGTSEQHAKNITTEIRAPCLFPNASYNPKTDKLEEESKVSKFPVKKQTSIPKESSPRRKRRKTTTTKWTKYAQECFCKYTDGVWGNFEEAKDFRSQDLQVVNVRNGLPMRTFGDLNKKEPFSAKAATLLE